ncbi:OmpA family protein [Lysobacter fragariae]
MNVFMDLYRLALSLLLCAVLLGCSGTVKPKAPASEVRAEPALASAEFLGVKFKLGHPSVGESFLDAATAAQEKRLEIDADGLRTIPGVRVEIVGFTDDQECSGQECYELSLRRAKSVYDWFISHGIPKERLNEPEGRGSEMAIYGNETEEGRQQNRRTEVNMIAP